MPDTGMPPFAIPPAGSDKNPAIAISNAVSGWTVLSTDSSGATAGVSGGVFAVGSQSASGALSGVALALDDDGDLGLSGAVSFGGSEPSQINAGYGAPSSGLVAPSGSLYLRSDSASSGPRLYQYQSLPSGASTNWLEIPLGLGIFNVKDYGALGVADKDSTNDDTSAIQAAIDAAESYILGGVSAQSSGAIVYFPPGQYNVFTPNVSSFSSLTVTGASNLTLRGAGSVSQILAAADLDVFYIPSGADGLTIRDLQIQYVGVLPNPDFGLSGAAMHFEGGQGDFWIQNVDTSNVGLGLYANNLGAEGRIINCKLKGNVAAAYVSCGAQIHHCEFNGMTYGLICDGSPGIKITNTPLYGALSLATWNTTSGGSSENSLFLYDVEANYSDPFKSLPNAPLTTTSYITLNGIGTIYDVYVISGVPSGAGGWPVYIRDDADNQLGGTAIAYISGGAFSMKSNLETSLSGTISAGASAWIPAPWYPSQVGGEGVGSASLVATSGEVHLADCWFQDVTVIGGTPPVTYATLAAPFQLTGAPTGTYAIQVAGNGGFLTGAGIYVLAPTPTSGSQAYAFGNVGSLSSTTGITFTSTTESAGGTSGFISAGAFVSQAFDMAGADLYPAPPEAATAYPFQPKSITIRGGSFGLEGPAKFAPAAQLGIAAIEVVEGGAVNIVDCEVGNGPNSSGYAIYVGPGIQGASIVGNILAAQEPSGAIYIGPSANINCQENMCQFPRNTPTSGAIIWPSETAQPFLVAGNQAFNPTGRFITISATGSTPAYLANSYGVPGTFYVGELVGLIGSGAITGVAIFSAFTSGYNETGLAGGAYHIEPGGSIRIAWTGVGKHPLVYFAGD